MSNTSRLFDAYFATVQDDVRQNCNVVQNTAGAPMLRIDKDVPEFFYPRFSENVGAKEDRTVPRICVAPSVLACLLGYWRSVKDILERPKNGYKNGFTISGLDWEYAFKPNEKLAADAPLTDEYWLLGYSEDTRKYQPATLGHFFIHTLVIRPSPADTENRMVVQLLVHNASSQKLKLDRVRELEQGYYRVTVDVTRMNVDEDSKAMRLGMGDMDTVQVEKISEEVYTHAHSTSVAIESVARGKAPSFLNW